MEILSLTRSSLGGGGLCSKVFADLLAKASLPHPTQQPEFIQHFHKSTSDAQAPSASQMRTQHAAANVES